MNIFTNLTGRDLYKRARPHFGLLLSVLLFILLNVVFDAISPLPFKILIDNVLGNLPMSPGLISWIFSHVTTLEGMALIVVLGFSFAILFGSITEYWVSVLTRKLSNLLIFDFARDAFEKLTYLSIGFYKSKEIGDYIYRLSYDISAIGDLFEFSIIPLITNTAYLLITIIILLFISVPLTLVALLMLPILTVGLVLIYAKISARTKRSENLNSSLFSYIEQALTQMRIIQAFNRQKQSLSQFQKKQNASLGGEMAVYKLNYKLDLLVGAVIAAGYGIVIAYGITLVFKETMSTGSLVIFIFYLDNLTYPLLSIMNAASSLTENRIKIARITELTAPKHVVRDTGTIKTLSSFNINFKGVSVKADDRKILNNVSFEIPENKLTVIVGANGSGKTTLLSLLLRFVDPSNGEIRIGGNNISDYSVESLRDTIAYMPQETILFDSTIKENLLIGDVAVPAKELREALHISDSDEFVQKIREGLNFHVGEEGMNLSGGQRQRILLARAVLKKNARILILDEPVSSLDVKNRGRVMDNIKAFGAGKTVIIVSNILEWVNKADNVILLNDGELTYAGHSAGLLKESKLAGLILKA